MQDPSGAKILVQQDTGLVQWFGKGPAARVVIGENVYSAAGPGQHWPIEWALEDDEFKIREKSWVEVDLAKISDPMFTGPKDNIKQYDINTNLNEFEAIAVRLSMGGVGQCWRFKVKGQHLSKLEFLKISAHIYIVRVEVRLIKNRKYDVKGVTFEEASKRDADETVIGTWRRTSSATKQSKTPVKDWPGFTDFVEYFIGCLDDRYLNLKDE